MQNTSRSFRVILCWTVLATVLMARADSLRFVVMNAPPHAPGAPQPAHFHLMLDEINVIAPDFVISCGESGYDGEAGQYQAFAEEADAALNMPFYPVIGHHESVIAVLEQYGVDPAAAAHEPLFQDMTVDGVHALTTDEAADREGIPHYVLAEWSVDQGLHVQVQQPGDLALTYSPLPGRSPTASAWLRYTPKRALTKSGDAAHLSAQRLTLRGLRFILPPSDTSYAVLSGDAEIIAVQEQPEQTIATVKTTVAPGEGAAIRIGPASLQTNNQAERISLETRFRFAVVGDPHISTQAAIESGPAHWTAITRGNAEILEEVLAELNEQSGLDFIIIVGDMIHQGRRNEFLLLKEILDGSAIPVYPVPGNHDLQQGEASEPLYEEILGFPLNYAFTHKGYRFLMVNSIMTEGRHLTYGFSDETLAWAESELEAHRDKPFFAAWHVDPPFPYQPGNERGFLNGDRFFELLTAHRVKAGFYGHTHRNALSALDGAYGPFYLINTPSSTFASFNLPPAVRIIEVNGDSFTSELHFPRSSRPAQTDHLGPEIGPFGFDIEPPVGVARYRVVHAFDMAEDTSVTATAMADLTGDGRDEILLAVRNQVQVYQWNSATQDYDLIVQLPVQGSGRVLAVSRDANGQNPQIAILTEHRWLRVFGLQYGDGGILHEQLFETRLEKGSRALAVTDRDADGRWRIYYGEGGEGFFVLPIHAHNKPGSPIAIDAVPTERFWSATLADVNGDGSLELIVGGRRYCTVLQQDTAGDYQAVWSRNMGDHVFGAAVADTAGNGVPELIVATMGRLHVFAPGPDFLSTEPLWETSLDPSDYFYGLTVGPDLDGNGKQEIIIGGGIYGRTRIYEASESKQWLERERAIGIGQATRGTIAAGFPDASGRGAIVVPSAGPTAGYLLQLTQ